MADSEDYVGIRSQYAATTETNQVDYQIKQKLREVYTNFVGIIQDCDGQEENSGASYVTVLPAVQQTDGQSNALTAAPIYKSPYGRYQYGVAAFIIDPVAGDRVLCCAPKTDSSGITSETTAPQAPASLAEFSQSNAISAVPILTKTPENWLVLRQDLTREGYSPEGIIDRTDQDMVINVGQNRTITIGADNTITISGNNTADISGNCNITIGGDDTVSINGSCSVTIGGDCSVTIGGSCSITVSGSCRLSAPNVTIDSPATTVTGNMTIAGTLSQGSEGGGAATFGGSVTAQGTITSNSDVTSNGISLTSHIHGGVEGGSGTTSGPQ